MSQTISVPVGTNVEINPSMQDIQELVAKMNATVPTTEPMKTVETVMVDKVGLPVKRINQV
jgi:hypothetical protein